MRSAVACIPATCRAAILENLPGDTFQVADIHMAVRQRGGRLLVVHLDSEDDVLIGRGAGRRVCHSCEPHEPAQRDADDPDLCGRCSGPLTTRRDNEQGLLRERTTRHRHYARGVLRMIQALDIPLVRIDAAADPESVEQLALDAITARTATASQPA